MIYDYIFFDLDGTLTDPAEGITNSFKHAIKSFGLEIPDYKTLLSFIGPPLINTWKENFGFDDAQAAEGVKKYREYFADKGLFENRVYDGIPELLQKLRAMGKKLVVATSKPEIYSVKIIEKFGLTKYFEAVCGSLEDETRGTKAEVVAYAIQKCGFSNPEKILMVGDRKYDVVGAAENGIKCCGVLYGYGNRAELEKAGVAYIAENLDDVYKIAVQ